MFAWLKSWFVKKALDSVDTYHPKERAIYNYWNGKELISTDPILIYKKIAAKSVEIDANMKVVESLFPLKDKTKIYDDLVTLLREIFTIPATMNEGGLSEPELFDLFYHFLTFIGHLKKNMNLLVIPWISLGGPETTSADNQPTMNSAASGSIANATSTAESPLLPAEPELPTVM